MISEGIKTWAVVALIIIVVAFGIFVFKGDNTTNKNPFNGKKIISTNTTCTKVKEAADIVAKLYNTEPGKIMIAECAKTCSKENLTLYDIKCTPDDEFICYCNKKSNP